MAPELAQELIQEIAARMVRYTAGDAVMPETSDAAWLETDLARWLANSMMTSSGAPSAAAGFTDTLIVQAGPNVPAIMANNLRPETTLDDMFVATTGASVPLLPIEQIQAIYWLNFFQHRLDLEQQLLFQPENNAGYLWLYDLEDPAVTSLAQGRLLNPNYNHEALRVVAVNVSRDANGQTYADVQATLTDASGQTVYETIQWRFTSGTWKRRS
jgi:hypothetical protein